MSSKGKQIYASAPLYRDDQKSVIKVIKYETLWYLFEFIKDLQEGVSDGKTSKRNHGKFISEASAIAQADKLVGSKKLDNWRSNDNIFSAISEQSEERQIKSFLDKYGSK